MTQTMTEALALGAMPATMPAFVIRPDTEGEPETAMRQEQVAVPEPGPDEAIVRVMAAGVNYNGVWAALGTPVSVFKMHREPFHIAGSDASGIVWKVGSNVRRW
ncbi:MAG TPA: crotonyl-CoA carboxylase/reductase, partial [Candidatus Dormibacteraeota bacterium]|nr:crotonyl-CoA carboxylase/reductase [Candidatus Dormibacteraeota bacterium]